MRAVRRGLRALLALAALASAGERPRAQAAQGQPPSPDDYLVVDCLLPGKVRQLGRRTTYLGARRPIRTTALDCRIRGGEYTAYDRADYRTALAVWQAAADAGDAEAQYYVGSIHEKGLGTAPDPARAAEWYRRAAEQGYAAAQVAYGYLCERGLGVAQDTAAALNWYRRAAGLPESVAVVPAAELEEQARLAAEHERLAAEVAALARESADLRSRLDEAEAQKRRAEEASRGDAAERQRLAGQVEALRVELAEKGRSAAAAQARLSATPPPRSSAPPPPSGLDFGRYHALVIGNGSYAALPALPAARDTARRVGKLLETRYGFRVHLLLDASRAAILESLNALRKELREDDNLLVFYAGHSASDPASDRGWWQPVDADAQSRVAWIPTQVLADHLELMPSRHALVIADAHFPGTLSRSSIARLPAGLGEAERRDLYRALLRKRSRLVLAPGAPGDGGAAARFGEALVGELEKGSGVLEASRLYQRVSERLTRQTPGEAPEFAPMRWAAHEGGADFFLVARP
jgi:hypothetical protein